MIETVDERARCPDSQQGNERCSENQALLRGDEIQAKEYLYQHGKRRDGRIDQASRYSKATDALMMHCGLVISRHVSRSV